MTFYDSHQLKKKRVLVVGAGLVGMCVALRLAQSGVKVVLVDKSKPATGASWAAAGMLAPAYEAAHEPNAHQDLFELCMAAADIWRDFAPWLQAYSDTSIDFLGMGTLACAANDVQEERLNVLEKACLTRNVPVRRLSAKKARKLDPSLSENLISALLLPTDQQVDNWSVIGALMSALADAGVQVIPNIPITHLTRSNGFWCVPHLGEFDNLVWTAGVSSGDSVVIDGEATRLLPNDVIVPVKGQMLSVDPMHGAPSKVLRFGAGYIAPKSTRIVIGATSEWGVADKNVNPNDIESLRQSAAEICPILGSAEIKMSWAGVRPGTSDHAPAIGWSNVEGIAIASGHYRNGILLSPLTGDIVKRLILEEGVSSLEQRFAPSRFESQAQTENYLSTN